MEDDALDNAQLHALHWAFFSSVMDKDFPELFAEFVTWCDSLSKEEMDSILSDDDEDMDAPVWAGVLPLGVAVAEPLPDPLMPERQVPPPVAAWSRGKQG